jgi:hypothetical protein
MKDFDDIKMHGTTVKLIVGFHNFVNPPTNFIGTPWARVITVREEETNERKEKQGWMIQPIQDCRVGIGTPALQPATNH